MNFKIFAIVWVVVGVLAMTIHATIDYQTEKKVDVVFMPMLSLTAAPVSFMAALGRLHEKGYTTIDFNKEKK